ncbi:MAG: hypothetical protein DBX55_07060 [Verrucomicrobia bacterium]|nr:MAG: hypothetical protein DBX55_07060 [Verrucomicrobiota bacterium]
MPKTPFESKIARRIERRIERVSAAFFAGRMRRLLLFFASFARNFCFRRLVRSRLCLPLYAGLLRVGFLCARACARAACGLRNLCGLRVYVRICALCGSYRNILRSEIAKKNPPASRVAIGGLEKRSAD